MNRKTRIILIVLIVFIIAGMALFPVIKRTFFSKDVTGDHIPAAQARGQRALNVNAMVLGYERLEESSLAYGTLHPAEEVDLSFETSGKITNIYFKEGTHVKKGTLLAKLNDAPLQAELKKLEAQMPLAQDRVYRQEQLLEREAVSLESYESVYTELEKLKADLELVKARIAQTELRAPFDGIIGLRNISEGAYASPSTIIARLTQVTPLRLEFSVNEHLARDIQPGTRIAFTVDKNNNTYYATVYAVDSRITMSTYTLTARATYPNNSGELSPGNYASIRFSLSDTEEAIVVPAIAMLKEMGRDLVYVYQGGIARQREITIGSRTASSVEVMEGLSPGDTLITSGVMQLRDGLPVNLSEINAGGMVQ